MTLAVTKTESLDKGSGVEIPVCEIEIDPVVERRVMRKFDMFVVPQMIILVILAYLDRSNIGTALSFTALLLF